MSIDVSKIEQSVLKVVAETVGDQLATLPTNDPLNPTIPAVVKARDFSTVGHITPNIPNYPYCVIDYTRITDDSTQTTQLTETFWRKNPDTQALEYVYEVHKIVTINVAFYGNRKNSVDSISNKLHMSLEVEQIRDLLEIYSEQDCRLRRKGEIVPSDSVLQDKYLEVREFDLYFAVLDEIAVSESGAGYFDRIDFDTNTPVNGIQGGLYEGDGDIDPLHVNVDTLEN